MLQDDKDVVLAAVAQNGFALQFASETLQEHSALRHICTVDLALEAAKLRSVLAFCLLTGQPDSPGLAMLSRDVVELTGANISRDAVAEGLACRHQYRPAAPNSTRKKRKVMAAT